MIEKIIDWCAHNVFIVLLGYLILIGIGIYSVFNLPVDAIPDLSENQVIIWTEYMGRSPEVVEQQVTYPLVTSLQGMPDVKAVRAVITAVHISRVNALLLNSLENRLLFIIPAGY